MYNMTSYIKQCLEILCCNVGASMQSGMYSGNSVPQPLLLSPLSLTALSDRSLIRQSGSLQSLTLSLTDVCKFTLENI